MKKLFLLLILGLAIPAPYLYADDDDEIPQDPPQEENDGGNNGSNNGNNNGSDNDQTTTPPIGDIVFHPRPLLPAPRSLSPIEGLYSNGVVTLYFASDLGCVSVTILSTTMGDMWFERGESSEGFVDIAVGYERGEYAITIETETAGTFVGNFYL